MPYDETLAQRLRDYLARRPEVVEKKMFGGLSFFLNGNMVCGVIGSDLVARLGSEQYAEALTRSHTRPFDMTGRPMKGWVVIAEEGIAEPQDLAEWVEKCITFAGSLPEK